jgi:heat shock protein HslJ
MRSAMRLAAAVVLGVTLTLGAMGCASPGPSSPDPRLVGTWWLASATDDLGPLMLGNSEVTLIIGDSGHTGGQDLCNNYRASVTGSTGVVYVRVSPAYSGNCPDEMRGSLDLRYLRALDSVRFASLTGDRLQLTSGNTNLTYLRGGSQKASTLIGTSWVLDQLPGLPQATDLGALTVAFTSDRLFEISGPCAVITSMYSSLHDRVSVAASHSRAATAAACDRNQTEISEQVKSILRGSFILDIHTNTLAVTSVNDSVTAVFRAK